MGGFSTGNGDAGFFFIERIIENKVTNLREKSFNLTNLNLTTKKVVNLREEVASSCEKNSPEKFRMAQMQIFLCFFNFVKAKTRKNQRGINKVLHSPN